MSSIRGRVLTAIALVFALLFTALLLGVRHILLQSYSRLENDRLEQNLERVNNGLARETLSVSRAAADYAYWTATYNYALGYTDQLIEQNFTVESNALVNLANHLVLITDLRGRPLFSMSTTWPEGELDRIPTNLDEYGHLAARYLANTGNPMASLQGFWRFDGRLAMVATRRILTSDQAGTPAGTFTFARYVDETVLAALSDNLRIQLDVLPYQNQYVQGALPNPSHPLRMMVVPISSERISALRVLTNLNGLPVGYLRIEMPRDVYQQGQQTIQIMALLMLGVGATLGLATSRILDIQVVGRLKHLSGQIREIRGQRGSTARVDVIGTDEIGALATSMNEMLERLDQSHGELALALDRAQEATRLKTEFLSTMSHELRTPLNAIIGYSGIMMEGIGGELDDEALRMVTNIHQSSRHLLLLVNEILDLAKIEAGRLEIIEDPFDIRALVQDVYSQMEVLAASKALTFESHISPSLPSMLIGDGERIKQVLFNLLSNAIKFTESGTVSLNVEPRGDRLVIAIRDSGIGIPPHALDTIFEEFRQLDGSLSRVHQGTGLGLAIVRRLVQAMDGRIDVTSTLGKGSTFTVTLPLKLTAGEPTLSAPVEWFGETTR